MAENGLLSRGEWRGRIERAEATLRAWEELHPGDFRPRRFLEICRRLELDRRVGKEERLRLEAELRQMTPDPCRNPPWVNEWQGFYTKFYLTLFALEAGQLTGDRHE